MRRINRTSKPRWSRTQRAGACSRRRHFPTVWSLLVVLSVMSLALALSAKGLQAQEFEDERRYSAIRFLEGEATLQNVGSSDRVEVEVNYPLLAGDRLWVPPGSRVHLSLADGSLLAVGGGTEVIFDQIAQSLDSEDTTTRLRLLQGRIDLLVDDVFAAAELPIIDTANARLFVQAEYTRLAVGANHTDWTEVTTREGLVEVLTPNGSTLVRPDEELVVRGLHDTTVDLAQAAPLQDLELWASDSADQLARFSYDGLEEPLPETAQLAEHGDWVEVEGSRAWRPRVAATWRPYSAGRWVHTPTGLYWTAYDPWSPVTYHYGGWDLHPRWGWVWYPGYRYAPAHVAWYFGPDYYGWIPTTYYRRHYGFHLTGFGFRFGIWGRAGGYWDPFYDWTFCPTGYFGARRGYHHYRSGYHYRDRGRLAHGYVTTDTTYIGKDSLRRPERIYRDLDTKRGRGAELVDVTPMLARGKDVPESVRKAILVRGETQSVAKVTRGVKTTTVNGVPRSKERGVSRATLGERSTSKRGTVQRGSVGTKSGSTLGRSATAKAPEREPAKVIVDGVRRGGASKTPTAATTTWRSTDRTRAPSAARPAPRSATPRTTAPRGGDERGKSAVPRTTTRTPTAGGERTRPSARPPSATPSAPPKARPPVNSRQQPTTSSPRATRSPKASPPPRTSAPKATPPPRSTSSRSPAVSRSSQPRARSSRPATSSRVPRATTSSRSTSARSPKAAPPRARSSNSSARNSGSVRGSAGRPAASSRSTAVRTPKASSSRNTRSAPSRSSASPRARSSAPNRSTRSTPSRSAPRSKASRASSSRSSQSKASSSKARPSKPPAD